MRISLVRWRWWLAAGWLVATLASWWVQSNQPDPALPDEWQQADIRSQARSAPVRIAYDDQGPRDAPVIVLLHGSPGSAGDFDRVVPPLLAAGYRVVRPDLPGFGASAAWVDDYGNLSHAHDVLGLLDHLQIARAHAVGFSMSGGVVLHLAELAPERVASRTLLAAIGIQEGEGSGSYALEQAKYATGWLALVALPEAVPHFGALGRRAGRHGFIRNFFDNDQRPLRALLEQPGPPLLILHGIRDPLVPVATARAHHSLVPGSRLVVYDSDHFLPFREGDAAAVAADLIAFTGAIDQDIPPAQVELTTVVAQPLQRFTPFPGSFAAQPLVALVALLPLTLIAPVIGASVAAMWVADIALDPFLALVLLGLALWLRQVAAVIDCQDHCHIPAWLPGAGHKPDPATYRGWRILRNGALPARAAARGAERPLRTMLRSAVVSGLLALAVVIICPLVLRLLAAALPTIAVTAITVLGAIGWWVWSTPRDDGDDPSTGGTDATTQPNDTAVGHSAKAAVD